MAKTHVENIRYGEEIAQKSFLMLLGLVIIKALAGFTTGFVVLLADAVGSLTDVVALFASYIGLRLGRRGANKSFQYGYYKVETLAALIVSLIILYLGYEVFTESFERLFIREETQLRFIGLISVVISIIFSIRMATKLEEAGKKANSPSLLSNAKEKRLDIISECAIFISVMADYFGIPYVEAVLGLIISALIFKEGIESTKESLFYLLDYWDQPEFLKKVEKTIKENSKIVTKIKKIRLRRAGTWIFGEAFLEISPFADTKDIRTDINRMENALLKLDPSFKDFIIFTLIPTPSVARVAVPIEEDKGLNSIVATHMQTAKYFAIVELKDKKFKETKVIPSAFEQKNYVVKTAKLLKDQKVDIIIDAEMDSLLYYMLQHIHHFMIYPRFPNLRTVRDTVKLLLIDT